MKVHSILLLLLLFPLLGNAQSHGLAQRVQQARAQKAAFHQPNLFQFAGHTKAANQFDGVVAEGQLLTLNLGNLKSLYQAPPQHLLLELPTGGNKPLKIALVKHQLLTEDFTLVTSGTNGQAIDYQPGAYYHGIVEGENNSMAAISVFEDEIIGVISTEQDGNMVLGRSNGAAKSASYIFYKENDLLLEYNFECGAGEEPVSEGKDTPNVGNEKVEKCVRVYLEAEYDLVTEKGGATGATNYLTGLFNAVAAAYQQESITTYISQIFTWTTPDTYPTSSTSAALTAFRAARPSYNGDVAHLVSRGAPTGGGVAWVDALCTSYAYAYSYIYSTYNQFPTYSWSVNVLAHEMGHNLGSPHTHACAWNGNNTAIDGCGPAVGANEGCSGPIPSAGTMMSYCHLVSGVGINFSLGFGPQPGDRIRNEVTSATCLTTCATQCLTVTTSGTNVSCAGGNNGTASATPSGGNGTYTYAWSNGGNTQTISNLVAGTYTVTVSSGSNCTGTASRVVTVPAALTTTTAVTNATGGQNNGAINLTVSGGTPAYAFLWSNGATTEDVSGLAAGTYTVTVTDSKGCTTTKSATVTNVSMTLNFAVTNASSGQSNGAVNLTVSNGVAPFTFAWSNGANTEDLVNVPAGTYSVTVTSTVSGTATGSATVGTNSSGCTSVNLPHSQSFENGLEAWTQATNDQINWTLLNAPTPTTNTGPDAASNGTYFAYTEATGNQNKTAFLLSPCVNIAGVNTFSFAFNYHMYGAKTGTLRIEFSLNNGNTWNSVWSKQGNKGNNWFTQSINFTNNGGSSIRFRVYAKTGNGETSDIAVDNFNIVQTSALTNGEAGETSIVLNPDMETSKQLNLSPNPVASELTVMFNSAQEQATRMTITDQTGRIIKNINMEAAEGNNFYQLDVEGLPTGLYFLSVEAGQHRRMERFVVLR